MSVTVIAEVKMKDYAAMEALLKAELKNTRQYEGCEGLTVHRNMDDPNNLVIVERWESRPHYENYLAWREETGVLAKLAEQLEGDPSIRFYSNLAL